MHGVGALAALFRHLVQRGIDDIDVVAEAAGHAVVIGTAVQRVVTVAGGQRVVACTTGQQVVAKVADQHVGKRGAGGVDVGAAGQRQVFQIRREGKGDRGLHGVGASRGRFGNHIAGAVDHIDVVADTTRHGIVADAAVDRVVAVAAKDRVVTV